MDGFTTSALVDCF